MDDVERVWDAGCIGKLALFALFAWPVTCLALALVATAGDGVEGIALPTIPTLPTSASRAPAAAKASTLPTSDAVTVTVNVQNLNLRTGPGTSYKPIGQVHLGETYDVAGRNEAGDWIQICCPEPGAGWISAAFVDGEVRPAELPVVEPVATTAPAPTSTPAPAADEAERSYAAAAQHLAEGYVEDLEELGELSLAVGDDPELLLDENWRFQMAARMVSISLRRDSVEALDPPPRFAVAHSRFMEAAALLDEAMDILSEGIDEIDGDKISRASMLVIEAGEIMRTATDELVAPTPAPASRSGSTLEITTLPAPQPDNCHPSYPDVCIPPPPPDLDCGDISHRGFRVLPPDPHGFDREGDGIGCEAQ